MDNSICTFEDLFKNLPKKKVNVISCCLFKLGTGYKDFSNYINGAKYLKKLANKIGFTLLIFIDDSIYTNKDIYDKLKENTYDENTIFIKYTCPKFKKDEIFHKGLFGTLIRFFPLFDFPNNPFKKVFVLDIDTDDFVNEKVYDYYVILKKLKIDGLCKIYSSLAYSDTITQFHVPYKNQDNIAFLAGCMCFNKKKLDHNILINYLNTIMDHNSELYKDMRKKTFHHDIDDTFAYGVDEYFLCNVLYYLFKKYDFDVYYYSSFGIYDIIKELYTNYKNNTLKNKEEYKKLLQTILHQPKNNDVDKLYNITKSILNSYKLPKIDKTKPIIKTMNYGANEKQLNISNNIYNYLENLDKTKNYKLIDKQSMDYILQHKGIIKCHDAFNKQTNKLIRIYNTYKF